MNKGKFIGATLIVAGTTIGAGLIALPMTAALSGFTYSSGLILGIWALMCVASLFSLEVNLRYGRGVSIAKMASDHLGPAGKALSVASLLWLFYALLAAYISGASSFISNLTGSLDLSLQSISVAFTLLFAFFVYWCTRAVDYANRLLFGLKMLVFVAMIAGLMSFVEPTNLFEQDFQPSSLWMAIPVFFTSFGFHGSIPAIVDYVGPKRRQLRAIFILGSLIPVVLYLFWDYASLGVLSLENFKQLPSGDVGAFIQALGASSGNAELDIITNAFVLLAITTSFLGVGLGLFAYIAEVLKFGSSLKSRFATALLTFLPSLAVALYYPQAFIVALGVAAIALSVLAIVIPCLTCLKQRKTAPSSDYQVFGGKPVLYLTLLCGLGVIAIELADLGLF